MKEIIEIIKLLIPFIFELIKLLKGESSDTKTDQIQTARKVVQAKKRQTNPKM